MGLDVADGGGRDAGVALGAGDDGGLAVDAGGGVADLGGTVVVGGEAADDGVDLVAVGESVGEALEGDDGDATAEDGALGLGVEGAAMAVG